MNKMTKPEQEFKAQQKDLKTSEAPCLWLVWRPGGSIPVRVHETEASAYEESLRLAKDVPGQAFYVLKTIGKAYGEVKVGWSISEEAETE